MPAQTFGVRAALAPYPLVDGTVQVASSGAHRKMSDKDFEGYVRSIGAPAEAEAAQAEYRGRSRTTRSSI